MDNKNLPRSRRVLSIDGGGIKGVMAAAYLTHLEETFDVKICEYFDLIVGTSTGGIIALALGKGIPARKILDLYEKRGPAIFNKDVPVSLRFLNDVSQWIKACWGPKHNPTMLAEEIKGIFGDTRIGESRTRLVIPSYIDLPAGPYLFKTAHHEELSTDYKKLMMDAALATAAAPIYLPKHILPTGEELVDGGVWANNPIGVAALEAVAYLGWDHKTTSILSLGYTSTILTYPQNGGIWRYFKGGKIVELLLSGQNKVSMATAKLLLPGARSEGKIVREELSLDRDYFKLDDTSKIQKLIGAARAMARKAGPDLRAKFFTTPCEPFNPIHKLGDNDNINTQAVA